MRTIRYLSLAGLLSGALFGQPAGTPAFELADVHVSAKKSVPQMQGGALRGDRYEVRMATMVDLVSLAYGVDPEKVIGGPSWLEDARFDVIAKAPPATSPDNLKLMLQSLLADRFKLVVHKDTKALPGFVLSLGKGKPKLKESDGSAPPGCQPVPQTPQPGVVQYQVASCHSLTSEEMAQNLRRMANAYLPSDVVDQTGLKGKWDFEIRWTGRGQLAAAGSDGISIFDAIDRQLGLKLEPQTIPMPIIKVDSVNQVPTPNAPGVTTRLPAPPPAEFEVADIKPTAPGATGQMLRLQPGGRLDAVNVPLKLLMGLAWNLPDDMIAPGPKSMETNHWDIIAKAPIGPPGTPLDEDAVRMMLRKLLEDRFKLTTHMEDRLMDAYTLLPGKPKMQKADPANRTSCKDGPGPDGKDPRIANPVLNRLIYCQNVTMAQLAERLQAFASGYIRSPVLDASGVEGAYDFTLNFSGAGLVRGGGGGGGGGGRSGGPGPAADAGGANSDPNGALSLPDAISKQLGLKLELQKRPVPMLVIDHVEEKPTEN